MRLQRIFILLFMILSSAARATHIVGGEMIYDFLGYSSSSKSIYRITLKVYRDCGPNTANFDGIAVNGQVTPAWITVLTASGTEMGVYNIGAPVVTQIPSSINNPCIETPNDVCVQQGIYTYTLELEAMTGGYYVIYQRCCRNNSILNIVQPGEQGSAYYTRIPGPETAAENSSPRFKSFPPIFLCSNVNFYFDHSAADPDGDQLVYSFYAPFNALDACCGSLFANVASGLPSCVSPPLQCPTAATLPPYPSVNYMSPYTASYPLASNPSLSIDPATGNLKGRPNLIGQYVVGVRVDEYRNGVLLNSHFRDFQFNIKSCVVSVVSSLAEQEKKCTGLTIKFNNTSTSNIGALTYLWDFGDPSTLADTSGLTHPTYTYQDTGRYTVTLIANPNKPCSDTIRREIYAYPPLLVKYETQNEQCFKDHGFDFVNSGSYMPQASYTWDFTTDGIPASSSDKAPGKVRFTAPGKYPVKLYATQLTCIDSFIDTVRLVRPPRAAIIPPEGALCDPARFKFGNSSEADEQMSFLWRFSNGKTSSLKEPEILFSPAGVYSATLLVSTAGVCKVSAADTLHGIYVYQRPKAGFKINPEVTTILEPLVEVTSTAGEGLNYLYDFGDGSSASYHTARHVYYDAGNYTITQYVTNVFGCTDSVSDIVRVLHEHRFWMPNTFTPDENGLNDVFKPYVIGVSNYEFEVFDRWGRRLFFTSDPLQGWDGSYRGEACKQDIYAWKISCKNLVNNQLIIRSGHVSLLRNL